MQLFFFLLLLSYFLLSIYYKIFDVNCTIDLIISVIKEVNAIYLLLLFSPLVF